MTSVILGVGNPFCDRTTHINNEFLTALEFTKGATISETNPEKVDHSWKMVPNKIHDEETLGGSGTNVIKTIAHLKPSDSNRRCALLGKIGADLRGCKIEQMLQQKDILSFLSKTDGETGIVNCFVTPDKERTMHTYLGAALHFSPDDINPMFFEKVSHMHIEGYLCFNKGTIKKSLAIGKEKQIPISFDLASRNVVTLFKHDFIEMLPSLHYLFGNQEEMEALTGFSDFKEAADVFSFDQTIVATQGSEGCWVKHARESDAVHFDALEVTQIADTTGAGDFFAGGFLHAALKGEEVFKCVQAGNLAASYVIQEVGAELPLEKWDLLKKEMLKI